VQRVQGQSKLVFEIQAPRDQKKQCRLVEEAVQKENLGDEKMGDDKLVLWDTVFEDKNISRQIQIRLDA